MNILYRWLGGIFAIWLTVVIGQKLGLSLEWTGFVSAMLFVLALAFVNTFIRPVVQLFALPLSCLTLFLFSFIINVLLFWGTASLTGGLKIGSFWAALFASIVYSMLSGIINSFVKKQRRQVRD